MTYHSAVFDALGDATRRHIFELVAVMPRSVAEIARHVPVSRPAVSQHLRVLKTAALVKDHAEGTRRIYALEREGLVALRSYVDQFWDQALDRFKAAAEQAAAIQAHQPKPEDQNHAEQPRTSTRRNPARKKKYRRQSSG